MLIISMQNTRYCRGGFPYFDCMSIKNLKNRKGLCRCLEEKLMLTGWWLSGLVVVDFAALGCTFFSCCLTPVPSTTTIGGACRREWGFSRQGKTRWFLSYQLNKLLLMSTTSSAEKEKVSDGSCRCCCCCKGQKSSISSAEDTNAKFSAFSSSSSSTSSSAAWLLDFSGFFAALGRFFTPCCCFLSTFTSRETLTTSCFRVVVIFSPTKEGRRISSPSTPWPSSQTLPPIEAFFPVVLSLDLQELCGCCCVVILQERVMGAITEPMMTMMLLASDAAAAAAATAEMAIIISSTYKLHGTTISSLLLPPCHSLLRSAAIGNKSSLPCLFLCILLLTRSAAVRKKTRSASSRKEWLSLARSLARSLPSNLWQSSNFKPETVQKAT